MRALFAFTVIWIASISPGLCGTPWKPLPSNSKDILYAPPPDYPYEARVRVVEGVGWYTMHVRPDGSVSQVDIVRSTGNPILDNSAMAALRRWRFKPGAVTVVTTPITFTTHGPKKT